MSSHDPEIEKKTPEDIVMPFLSPPPIIPTEPSRKEN